MINQSLTPSDESQAMRPMFMVGMNAILLDSHNNYSMIGELCMNEK